MSQGVYTNFNQSGLYRGLTNNSTATSFVVPVPIATEPVSVDSSADPSSNSFVTTCGYSETLLYPFGTDTDNQTLNFRVYLWKKIQKSGTQLNDLWVPYFVGGFAGIISMALNGVASSPLTATEGFCDTITEEATNTWDDGYTPATVRVRSYTNDQLAEVRILTNGYQKIEVRFDIGSPTATGANVCFSKL